MVFKPTNRRKLVSFINTEKNTEKTQKLVANEIWFISIQPLSNH